MESLFKLLEKKIEKVKVIPAQTLFDPDWKQLNDCRCPLCCNKLKLSKRKLWICRGKKHAKPYIITEKRMNELRVNQEKKKQYLINKEKWASNPQLKVNV